MGAGDGDDVEFPGERASKLAKITAEVAQAGRAGRQSLYTPLQRRRFTPTENRGLLDPQLCAQDLR